MPLIFRLGELKQGHTKLILAKQLAYPAKQFVKHALCLFHFLLEGLKPFLKVLTGAVSAIVAQAFIIILA